MRGGTFMSTSRFARVFVPTARFTKSGPTRRGRALLRGDSGGTARCHSDTLFARCRRFALWSTGGRRAAGWGSGDPPPQGSQRKTATVILRPQTIFFGGGTPTALTTAQLEFLLRGFHKRWTFAAPGMDLGSESRQRSRAKAAPRELGVNRISLGVQSWDDGLLRLLGREHNAAQAEASISRMREAGFRKREHRSDVRVARHKRCAQWEATLRRTSRCRPDHVSAYCLTYEEDTEFFSAHARGEYRQDAERRRFFRGRACASRSGGIRAIRNLELRAPRPRIGAQSRLLARRRLSRHRAERVLDRRAASDGRTWRIIAPMPIACSPVRRLSSQIEALTPEMKRGGADRALAANAVRRSARMVGPMADEMEEFVQAGFACRRKGRTFVLTQRRAFLADSVAAAFV